MTHSYPWSLQLTVGVAGLSSSQTKTLGYGDWTATAQWSDARTRWRPPWPRASVSSSSRSRRKRRRHTRRRVHDLVQPEWNAGRDDPGRHYGIFAPTGSTWTGTGPLQSRSMVRDYLSIALLPDNQPATSSCSASTLTRSSPTAACSGSTTRAADGEHHVPYVTTPQGEQRHQRQPDDVRALPPPVVPHVGPADELPVPVPQRTDEVVMRAARSRPSLPFEGAAGAAGSRRLQPRGNCSRRCRRWRPVLPVGPTYENGRLSPALRTWSTSRTSSAPLLNAITSSPRSKGRLEEWFTPAARRSTSTTTRGDVLTGYPSGYGATTRSTITTSIRPTRSRRGHGGDTTAGLTGSLGRHGQPADPRRQQLGAHRHAVPVPALARRLRRALVGGGTRRLRRRQQPESSSESMNFATAAILWGQATGQTDIRDLGVYLHATEKSAVEQYWFDVDNAVFLRPTRARRHRHGLGRQGRSLDPGSAPTGSSSTASTSCP